MRIFCAMAIIIGAGTGASSDDYELIYSPEEYDPLKVYIYSLSNGLKVYLSENHEIPRFYAEIAVRAGSQHDPPETTGLAHYFEHLMFKGSERLGTTDYDKEKPLLDKIEQLYEEYRKIQDPEKRAKIYEEIDKLNQEASKYAVPNELDKVYKMLGGDKLNAHTWIDETVYKVELPSQCLEHWAIVESDRFTSPVFRLFPTELETVYEEKNRAMDNRERVLMETVNKFLFPDHPFGTQTTLGDPEHLKNPSILNIKKFFKKWYRPENMAICISGDIKVDEAIKIISKYFSKLSPDKNDRVNTNGEVRLEENSRSQGEKICSPVSNYCYGVLDERVPVEIQFEGEPSVLLAFRTVPKLHPDSEKIVLVDMILDNAVAGLININLNQKQLVGRASSIILQTNDLGVEYLIGTPKEGQSLEEVEQLLLEQLRKVCEGDFEDWLLPAIITDFKKTRERARETNEGRVSEMTDAFIAQQDWKEYLRRIERFEKVTKEDIVETAKRYFSKGYVAGYRRDGKREITYVSKPKLMPVDIDSSRSSKFAQEVLSIPVLERNPTFLEKGRDYLRLEDQSGLTYWYVKNPLNRIFSFEIRVGYGFYHNPKLGVALRLLEKSGTERLSPEDLKKEWYKLGAEFSVVANNNETLIELSGLEDKFEDALKLMIEVMFSPKVEGSVLDELRKIIITQRGYAKKDPDEVMRALVQYNRLGNQSYYLMMPREEELNSFKVEDLFEITKSLLNYKQNVFYVGTMPIEKIRDLYEGCLRNALGEGKILMDPPSYVFLKSQKPEDIRIYCLDKDVTQATVRIEFGVEGAPVEEEPVVEIFNQYFGGGMAGIVFQELREARALAYVAGAQYIGGYRKGDEDLMIGLIQTQPDKVIDAVDNFLRLLKDLPVSEERFNLAKEALIGDYQTDKIPFRKILSRVYGWYLHGIDGDPRKDWYERIKQLELKDVIEFHKNKLQPKGYLISIMGPLQKIDMGELEKFGKILQLTVDDIFVK
ncbi:MAG: insulinase family protein [Candidatus Hydrogenedentes bacterium]|nr:insulinase family protein [Candidatus Hydrogenedentota bacterium]